MKLKQQQNLLKGFILLMGIFIFGVAIYFANYERITTEYQPNSLLEFETARVIQVLEDHTYIDVNIPDIVQGSELIELEILSSGYQGEIVEATHHLIRRVNTRFNEGDRVSVLISTHDWELINVAFDSFERKEVMIASVFIVCSTAIIFL